MQFTYDIRPNSHQRPKLGQESKRLTNDIELSHLFWVFRMSFGIDVYQCLIYREWNGEMVFVIVVKPPQNRSMNFKTGWCIVIVNKKNLSR